MSKKVVYLLLLLLFVINLGFRYPTTQSETGADSFMVHAQADSISGSGYIKWFVHPLSFFGLYPLSEESGGPLLLSGFSQQTGIDMESTILVVSTFVGLVGAFGTFLLGKEIINTPFFGFIVAMIFSLSRIFLSLTDWTFSTRGMFLMWLPFLIYLLLLCLKENTNKRKIYPLFALFAFVSFSTHNLSLLVLPFVIIPFIAVIIITKIRTLKEKRTNWNTMAVQISYLGIFIILVSIPFFGITRNPSYYDLQSGYFFQGKSFFVVFVNLIIEYAVSIGILSPFFLVGFFYCLKDKKNPRITFLLLLLLAMAPFTIDIIYVRTFFGVILSVIIGIGIFKIFKNFTYSNAYKPIVFTTVIVLILTSVYIPVKVTFRETSGYTSQERDEAISKQHNPALYIKYTIGEVVLASGFQKQIAAFSGEGYTIFDMNTDVLIHDVLEKNQMEVEPKEQTIEKYAKSSGELYSLKDWLGEGGYYPIKRNYLYERFPYDSREVKRFLEGYDVHYMFMIDYESFLKDEDSNPLKFSVVHSTYKVYDDGAQSGWFLYSSY